VAGQTIARQRRARLAGGSAAPEHSGRDARFRRERAQVICNGMDVPLANLRIHAARSPSADAGIVIESDGAHHLADADLQPERKLQSA
jgi:hypothetical protein